MQYFQNALPDISGLPAGLPAPISGYEKSPEFKRGLPSGLLGCGVGRSENLVHERTVTVRRMPAKR